MQKEEEQRENDDKDVQKIINRKISMNEQNVVGMNFEKYNDSKPSDEIRVSFDIDVIILEKNCQFHFGIWR